MQSRSASQKEFELEVKAITWKNDEKMMNQ